LAMMARRHVLHAQVQRTTSLAFRRRKISRSRRSVGGDDAHGSSSIVRFFMQIRSPGFNLDVVMR
jgi:hypothetical protein